MRVAVIGRQGQLGRQVERVLTAQGISFVGWDLPELDICDPATAGTIAEAQPDVVIHTAAMTDVDGCARDPDAALRVNGLGTRNVALGARRAGASMVYISSNEVFAGDAHAPYDEFSPIQPPNPYGRSKAVGEQFVRELVPNHYIVRTAWLFGPGSANFITKILERAEAGTLAVVDDEVGSPTYAPDLAEAIVQILSTGVFGTYHLVNEGIVSRYELAAAALEISKKRATIRPIKLEEYPRPSIPPAYSPLRNFAGAELGIRLRPWRAALSEYLAGETL